MNILILGGAGMMSVGTARDLLSELSPGVTRVVAADASETRLAALKAALPDPRLETTVVDVTDEAAVAALLANCDLCINGVPTFAGLQMAIFEACLKAGRAYADFGGMGVYTVKQKAEHARFVEAGVTAVIGLGADPGLSNLICRAAADRLDQITAINLYWTATRPGSLHDRTNHRRRSRHVHGTVDHRADQRLDRRLQRHRARAVEPQHRHHHLQLHGPAHGRPARVDRSHPRRR